MTTGAEEIYARPEPDGGEGLLAVIFWRAYDPVQTCFCNQSTDSLQVGTLVFQAGSRVAPHVHLEHRREVYRTQEFLMVRKGLAELTVYDSTGSKVAVRHLSDGDAVFLAGGGHSIEFLHPTTMFEVKTGPYHGRDKDKRTLETQE